MRVALRKTYGSPKNLEIAIVAKPQPKEGELLVKVAASSATTADTMIRKGEPKFGRLFLGLFKPSKPITGTGFAGTIESIGSGVSDFAVGDRVFGETGFNFSSNAEYITISEKHLVEKIPDEISFQEAAPICDGALTSWNFLTNIFKVKPGQTLLINGAAGGLGTSAIQIGVHLGAKVTAICSGANKEFVTSLGAHKVIDYTKEDFTRAQEKYDIVFDTIGKSTFPQCESVLNTDGVYLSPVLSLKLLGHMMRTSKRKSGKRAFFSATGALPIPQLREMISQVVQQLKSGVIHTEITKTFLLEDIVEAHQYIETGHKRGNIVLITEK